MAAIPPLADSLGPQPNFGQISKAHQQMSEHHQALSTAFSNRRNNSGFAMGDQILAALAESNQRLNALTISLNGTNQRLDGIDQRLDGIDQRLGGIKQQVDAIDQQVDAIDQQVDGIDQQVDGIVQRLDTMQDGMHTMYVSLPSFI